MEVLRKSVRKKPLIYAPDFVRIIRDLTPETKNSRASSACPF
jgi:hypothetical protein